MRSARRLLAPLCLVGVAAAAPMPSYAQAPQEAQAQPSYADLADLADSAPVILRVQIRKLSRVEPERSRGLRPGWARFYIEARTEALLTAASTQGEAVRYLADVPLDSKGKPPKLKKQSALLFARAVAGRPGELQLVAPDAQLAWNPAAEARLRGILTELVAPDAPPRVMGVREAIHVPGNLAGEGETQFFLDTENQSAASITMQHRAGVAPAWGVSFSEVAAAIGDPPARDTLAWYRLACFLPNRLPPSANLSESAASRAQAEGDYRTVLGQLGQCLRTRG
ncbi:MAG TPA: hypothetical protein VGE05_13535 [Novosphingobium sp.]